MTPVPCQSLSAPVPGRRVCRPLRGGSTVGRAGVVALGAAIGCAEPFTVDRHTLGPPRLAALGVHEGVARAAVWSGTGSHTQAPELSWTLDGEDLGEGFDVPVEGPGTLGVTVRTADGTELQGAVSVGEWVELGVVRQSVTRPADPSLEVRRQTTAPQPLPGSADMAAMVRLTTRRADDRAASARWMLGRSDWSVLELDARSADVLPADVTFDDGAVASVVEGEGGIGPVLALSVDGDGHNGWRWIDVAFSVRETLLDVQGRLLPIGPEVAAEAVLTAELGTLSHVVATLERDPTAASGIGLALVDVEAGSGASWADDLTDFPSPDCAPAGEPFPLWAVTEGRCPVDLVAGARVVLELR